MVVKVEPDMYAAANHQPPPMHPATGKQQQLPSKPHPPAAPAASGGCKSAGPEPATLSPPSAKSLPFREYCGNSKRITVESNCAHLRIVGNGNRIFVHRNCGRLEVLGNGNRLRVLDNRSGGRITYTGNGGRVYLCGEANGQTVSGSGSGNRGAAEVQEPIVRYTGVNGSVRLVARSELLKALSQPEAVVPGHASAARRAGKVPDKAAIPVADDESGELGDESRSSAAATAAMECGSARPSSVTGASSATVIGASGEQQQQHQQHKQQHQQQKQQQQQAQRQQHATNANRICGTNPAISLENLGTISSILRQQRQQMAAVGGGGGGGDSGSVLVVNDMR